MKPGREMWSVDDHRNGACLGIVVENGCVVEVAPISWWAQGKPIEEVLSYFIRMKVKVEHVGEGFTIVSGGQTGADRGGLDAAIEMDVPHRGWCPLGRRSEDGAIPPQYNMRECQQDGYALRTELNVADSHGTILFTYGPVTGGSKVTYEFIATQKKPYLWVDLRVPGNYVPAIVEFIQKNNIRELNIAGNRESKAPGIQAQVKFIMMQVLVRL